MKQLFTILAILLIAHTSSNAGTLIDGNWTPSNCGEIPEPPVVDTSSVENFNRSVDAINEWQDRALEYHSCMVDEANADNDLIANTANESQARFQEEINRVNAEAAQGSAELEN